jgi:hypothetical protein
VFEIPKVAKGPSLPLRSEDPECVPGGHSFPLRTLQMGLSQFLLRFVMVSLVKTWVYCWLESNDQSALRGPRNPLLRPQLFFHRPRYVIRGVSNQKMHLTL